MDWMVNNNWVAWILVCKLRTYNLTVKFLKYEFNNTLLGDVILFKIKPGKTWIQPYIYMCVWRKKLGTNIFRSFDWLFFEINIELQYYMIGKQKNKPNSWSSKESSRANRAVWTKNHPRRDSTWTNTTLKSVKVVHTNRPCSSSMNDLQMSMDDQNLLRPDRRIHNTWRNFKCCNSY